MDEEICHFSIRQAASHRRSRTQDSAIGVIRSRLTKSNMYRRPARYAASVPNFFATRRKVSGRNGKRSAFLDYQERRPQTQNKKRKSHEKSKHSVQTSRTSDAAPPSLLCGSVYRRDHSGSSRRDG